MLIQERVRCVPCGQEYAYDNSGKPMTCPNCGGFMDFIPLPELTARAEAAVAIPQARSKSASKRVAAQADFAPCETCTSRWTCGQIKACRQAEP